MKPKPSHINEPVAPPDIRRSVTWLWLAGLLAITIAVYYNSLSNKFINWDDDLYVTANNDIRTLHGDSVNYTLEETFKTYVAGNYHPLTMLTYCIEYRMYGLNPWIYHLDNLLLHLLNALMVFSFIWLLVRQNAVAFITALLFAVHPMHVESVVWIAERKDVLYAFFYLAALCTYVLFIRNEKFKWCFYVITLIFFVLGLLSKAMMVSLPIVFFAIDYFNIRKPTLKRVSEKIPFIILSVVFGLIAIKAQGSALQPPGVEQHNFFERVLFFFYALLLYGWKLLVPFNLMGFYHYPVKQDGSYPIIVYGAPLLIVGLLFLLYKYKPRARDMWFGLAFFFITIALVLQILPVGGALIAERYTYLPYIGLCFIIARLVYALWVRRSEKRTVSKLAAAGVLIFFVGLCSFLSAQRSKVWHDSISFWRDEAEKNDKNRDIFLKLGSAYDASGQYEDAIKSYSDAAQLDPDYPNTYYVRGNCYYILGKYMEAAADFAHVIQLEPQIAADAHFMGTSYHQLNKAEVDLVTADIYYLRGNCYYNLANYGEAISDYTESIRRQPTNPDAYSNRGLAYSFTGETVNAINDFTTTIQQNPLRAAAYNVRGYLYGTQQNFKGALADYNKALELKKDYFEALSGRGFVYLNLKNYEAAIKDYDAAIQLKPDSGTGVEYYNRGLAYFNLKNFRPALQDVLKARQMGYQTDPRLITAIQNGLI